MKTAKKINLAKLPTPLDKLERLSAELKRDNLYIKRDDLTDVGLSGNKVRKLEFILQRAIQEGADTVLTYGGVQTNHGRLTAAAACKLGLQSILILEGAKPKKMSGNLLLDLLFGADLRFTEGREAKTLAQEVIEEYRTIDQVVYEIPMGGSDTEGVLGYFFAVQELMAQVKTLTPRPWHLVVGAGSMGTVVGLLLGIKYFKAPFHVQAIAVTARPFVTLDEAVKLGNETSKKYDLGVQLQAEDFTIHEAYTGLGYNVPDEATRASIRLLAGTEAILTDPCYSGKVLRGFIDLAKKIPQEEGLIFLHTGGVPGLYSLAHLEAFEADLW